MVSTHLKNIRQIGNLPQVGTNIKNVWNHHIVRLAKPKRHVSSSLATRRPKQLYVLEDIQLSPQPSPPEKLPVDQARYVNGFWNPRTTIFSESEPFKKGHFQPWQGENSGLLYRCWSFFTSPPVNWWLEDLGTAFLLDHNLEFMSSAAFRQGTFSGWIPNSSATAQALVLWSPVHIQTSSPPKGSKNSKSTSPSFFEAWQLLVPQFRCRFPRW